MVYGVRFYEVCYVDYIIVNLVMISLIGIDFGKFMLLIVCDGNFMYFCVLIFNYDLLLVYMVLFVFCDYV